MALYLGSCLASHEELIKKFFIFHVALAFLTQHVFHASVNLDVNHSIFISVMGSVKSGMWRDDVGAQLLLGNTNLNLIFPFPFNSEILAKVVDSEISQD